MRNATMMIRFLDLTLIVLMAFLLQADLVLEREVGLPYGDAEGDSTSLTLRLTVEPTLVTLVNATSGEVLCGSESLGDLETCLRTEAPSAGSVLVSPAPGVVVQRMVDILDLCVRAQAVCGLAPLPETASLPEPV